MKRLLTLACLLAFLLPLGAQELTLPEIEETWLNDQGTISVQAPKGNPGIAEFAVAFSRKYQANVLVGKLYNKLVAKLADEDVADFDLDTRNGYVGISLVSDGDVHAQMCYWNLPDGTKRIGVKLLNVYELPRPLLFFYDYDGTSRTMQPLHPSPVDHLPDFTRCDFSLPKTGKDIRLYPEYETEGEAWLRFAGLDGFRFEGPDNIEMADSMAPGQPIVYCFIVDESKTNIRQTPGGAVIAQLSPEQIYSLIVTKPSNGWWQIEYSSVSLEGDEEGEIQLAPRGTPCWIHYSVLGISTRNYGENAKLDLYAEPSWKAAVSGTLIGETLVHPIDVSADGGWVKVRYEQLTGWVRVEDLCSNPLTTCP